MTQQEIMYSIAPDMVTRHQFTFSSAVSNTVLIQIKEIEGILQKRKQKLVRVGGWGGNSWKNLAI